MIQKVINLLSQHNTTGQGIYIPQGVIPYVQKLESLASFIYKMQGQDLVGFIAYYHNDPAKDLSFLSMLLVDEHYQSNGIGSWLMSRCIAHLDEDGFQRIQLEVLKDNGRALHLYQKFGFKILEDRDRLFLMERCRN
ncbi:GNAT family N-acetyltransferase [Sphingobacterium lactis]|uniref:GNAT family N-acetyltransferase n=1 Tax=Sphingobacterium lactis TaxID=797291 RepID=UPI003EC5A231